MLYFISKKGHIIIGKENFPIMIWPFLAAKSIIMSAKICCNASSQLYACISYLRYLFTIEIMCVVHDRVVVINTKEEYHETAYFRQVAEAFHWCLRDGLLSEGHCVYQRS